MAKKTFTAVFSLNAGQFSTELKKLRRSVGGFSKDLKSMGQGMSLGITAPIVAAGGAMLKSASDAVEARSKFNAVFQDTASSVQSWSQTFGQAVNRSRFDLQAMAASVQDTFVPLGFARGEAANMSTALTELAVDVASFNNQQDSEVMRNFTSALVGNHEAVRSYGIVITEATLKAELARMGMQNLSGAALEQAKVQARLNLLYAGTQDAQGDAARTSGEFANQLRGLQANIKDLSIEMGMALLPIAKQVIGFLRDAVSGFQSLSPHTKTMTLVFAGLAAAIGPVLVGLGAAVAAIGALFSPIGLAVAAIASMSTAFVLFKDEFMSVLRPNGTVFYTLVVDPNQRNIDTLLRLLVDFLSWYIEQASRILNFVGADGMAERLQGWSDALEGWGDTEIMVFDETVSAFKSAASSIGSAAKAEFDKLKNNLTGNELSLDIPVLKARTKPLLMEVKETSAAIQTEFKQMSNSASNEFAGMLLDGQNVFSSLGQVAKNAFSRIAQDFLSSGISSLFGGLFGGGGGGLLGGIGKIFGFASGGTINPGQVALVGERGPELIRPSTSMNVSSAADTRRMLGGGTKVEINIDARGAQDGLEERLRATMVADVVPLITSTVDGRISNLSRPSA